MSNTVKGFEIENGTLVRYSGQDKVVEVPNTVTTIGQHAFGAHDFTEKVIIPDSVTKIERLAFIGNSPLNAVELPETLEFIGHQAFSHCTGLDVINIPASIKEIGDFAFLDCIGLSEETIQQIQKINPKAYELKLFHPENPNNPLKKFLENNS